MSNRPYKLFLSYAYENEAVQDRLKNYLDPLIRSELIGIWDDREIAAGTAWRAEIDSAMERTDGAEFLVCADGYGRRRPSCTCCTPACCITSPIPASPGRRSKPQRRVSEKSASGALAGTAPGRPGDRRGGP